jgi:hypothetical protein
LTSFIALGIIGSPQAFSRFKFFTNIFACQWLLPDNVPITRVWEIII